MTVRQLSSGRHPQRQSRRQSHLPRGGPEFDTESSVSECSLDPGNAGSSGWI